MLAIHWTVIVAFIVFLLAGVKTWYEVEEAGGNVEMEMLVYFTLYLLFLSIWAGIFWL